ncbi:LysR family transcriptional regulator [Roseibium litorale]|uniref:LysR family transcriptional regulator n=1 Tax=Roseibium litorale TaxID=2803841 RepID=A0ABR9CIP8_9HYPH|nr:LysR family transcriptional regulator [Roseibium litorale]MBD8890707.1 LysR family transcriptional regulator [Roseibium litorale]
MSRVDPFSIDFNALRTLVQVFDSGSFSGAAERLDVNQSTVSYTIERLRKALQDPLFVRQGSGIAATDRCSDIVAGLRDMLESYQAIATPRAFDPAEAAGLVSLSCNYYERLVILPELLRVLRAQAPGLSVAVHQAFGSGGAQLKRGDSDFLMGPIRFNDSGLYKRRLLNDHYVCVMDRGNPLASRTLDLASYVSAAHAVVTYGGNWKSNYLLELEKQGILLNQVLGVPSPADLGTILRGTDLIATLPSRMAASMDKGVVIRPCPCPAPFDIDLVWTSRTQHSPMHAWVRQEIARIANSVPPASALDAETHRYQEIGSDVSM